jgi:hypothetical protein
MSGNVDRVQKFPSAAVQRNAHALVAQWESAYISDHNIQSVSE